MNFVGILTCLILIFSVFLLIWDLEESFYWTKLPYKSVYHLFSCLSFLLDCFWNLHFLPFLDCLHCYSWYFIRVTDDFILPCIWVSISFNAFVAKVFTCLKILIHAVQNLTAWWIWSLGSIALHLRIQMMPCPINLFPCWKVKFLAAMIA